MFQDFDISVRVHQLLQKPPGKEEHEKVSFYFCLCSAFGDLQCTVNLLCF